MTIEHKILSLIYGIILFVYKTKTNKCLFSDCKLKEKRTNIILSKDSHLVNFANFCLYLTQIVRPVIHPIN